MRILELARDVPYFPGGHGGNIRVFCLIRALSSQHRFTVVTTLQRTDHADAIAVLRPYAERIEFHAANGARANDTSAWRLLREEWRYDRPRLARKLWRFVVATFSGLPSEARQWDVGFENIRAAIGRVTNGAGYDVLQIEGSENATWARRIGFRGPTVLVVQDVKTVSWWRRFRTARHWGDRLRALNQTLRFLIFERIELGRFDRLVAMSEVDRRHLQRLTRHPAIMVVPNGVDVDYYQPSDGPPRAGRIAFVATLNHPPNTDGILFFLSQIWPLVQAAEPEATLDIVGRDPSATMRSLASERVRVTGFVDDVRPFLADASVVICPLRFASGTRLKILEAMAMGKPVVATPVGAEGINAVAGESLILADGPTAFAEAVVALLRDGEARRRIGAAARAVAERYAWSRVAARMDDVYQGLRYAEPVRRSARLRIALDASAVTPGGVTGGIAPSLRHLVAHLLELDAESRYVLLVTAANVAEFDDLRADNLERQIISGEASVVPRLRQAARVAATRWGIASALPPDPAPSGHNDVDFVHGVSGYLGAVTWNHPSILTLNDIQHEYHPEFFDEDELAARRARYGPAAARAAHIIVPSQFTRDCVIERLRIAPDKITVIAHGVGGSFFSPVAPTQHMRVRRAYRLPERYAIYSANLWPHKNHDRLLTALARLPRSTRPHLVLTGAVPRLSVDILELIRRHDLEQSISWLGYVEASELPALFAAAELMVVPSLFEGFGLPIVEAMAAGCPVACSNVTSLPEIAGDAALLFDPSSSEAIADAIDRIWRDAGLREQLRCAGRARARQFTWQRSALETLQLYRRVAAQLAGGGLAA